MSKRALIQHLNSVHITSLLEWGLHNPTKDEVETLHDFLHNQSKEMKSGK